MVVQGVHSQCGAIVVCSGAVCSGAMKITANQGHNHINMQVEGMCNLLCYYRKSESE